MVTRAPSITITPWKGVQQWIITGQHSTRTFANAALDTIGLSKAIIIVIQATLKFYCKFVQLLEDTKGLLRAGKMHGRGSKF